MIVTVLPRRLFLGLMFFSWVAWETPAYCGPLDVFVGGVQLGTFTVETFVDTSSQTGSTFGVAIQGGFQESGNLALPAGYEYRWIQTVNTSAPINDWQSAGQTYVDRSRVSFSDPTVADQSPFYASFRQPGQGYTLPFLDNPARTETSFTGTWNLTLAAVQAPTNPSDDFDASQPGSGRDIFAITTFTWGFSIGTRPDGTIGVLPLDPPTQRDPDDLLTTAFANEVNLGGDARTFGGGAWTLLNGFPTVVVNPIPEPTSIVMGLSAVLLSAGGLSFSRRRSRPAA
ncbi:hypothetical protein [Paludisphaera mucosa]|uniref:PEP-CTERM protein-sorting domain-containing protein n=1 Tax=Paludisphaera mucosa TaxID=3030827 RepID=A0ABT6F5R5_9BACT|nr:hypothetical protein [Paludisphaera mucosa]MDG3002915.1 hypothetical protein [Paludisphaera mucosa]